MSRFNNWIRSMRLTTAGALLLSLLAIGLVLALLGPRSAQAPGLYGAAVILLILVGVGLSGGRTGAAEKTLADYRHEFRSRNRDAEAHTIDTTAEAQAWESERERYRERQGG